MARNYIFPDTVQNTVEILQNYKKCHDSIRLYFSKANPKYEEVFISLTSGEIEKLLTYALEENERASILSLLSCCEARIRIDYECRCIMKKKDLLSRTFKVTYDKYKTKVHFEEYLLKEWRKSVVAEKKDLDYLSEAFKYRHWLAHGRYWELKINIANFDITSIYMVVEAVLKGCIELMSIHEKPAT